MAQSHMVKRPNLLDLMRAQNTQCLLRIALRMGSHGKLLDGHDHYLFNPKSTNVVFMCKANLHVVVLCSLPYQPSHNEDIVNHLYHAGFQTGVRWSSSIKSCRLTALWNRTMRIPSLLVPSIPDEIRMMKFHTWLSMFIKTCIGYTLSFFLGRHC
jgi:hypothetical protein